MADEVTSAVRGAAGDTGAAPGGGVGFRRDGQRWIVSYEGTTCRLRDAAGMRYLAHLVARPGQSIAAPILIREARRPFERRPAGRTYPDSIHGAAAVARRAGTRVAHAVHAALARIARHDAPLAAHLAATITTGAYCSYMPLPTTPGCTR